MAKIILVTPDYHCGVVESAGRWPNLGFVYMAGELRKAGHEVKIYDAMAKNHKLDDIISKILAFQPDIVGTTAFTATMPAAAELAAEVKKHLPQCITVIGGIHPTFCHQEVLTNHPYIDYVVRFEGEITFPELVTAIENTSDLSQVEGIAYRKAGQIMVTPERPFVHNLDNLTPAWDLLDWEDYTFYIYPGSRLAIISTSRGCMHGCKFCSQQKFWRQTWRARSADSVVGEIEQLVKRHDISVFFISDEYPTSDRERWVKILDMLIEKDLGANFLIETRVDDILRDEDIMDKYRQAGIIHIYVGIEATSEETLDLFNKGVGTNAGKKALDIIHKAGIVTETSFILGTPDETEESIKRTLAAAKKYNPDFAHFLLLAPWPYADMYSDLEECVVTTDYSKYNLIEPVIKPKNMTTDELFGHVLKCYQSFYFGKITEWANLRDGFKRKYAVQSMQAIMENSFLQKHILKLGTMPKKVQILLKSFAPDTYNRAKDREKEALG